MGEDACSQYFKYLKKDLQSSLCSPDLAWQRIREKLIAELKTTKNLEIVIKCNSKLWKFPWHEWDLLEEYPDAGISYCSDSYSEPEVVINPQNKGKVRILSILGNDKNIDLTADGKSWSKLKSKGAEIRSLKQPSAHNFIEAVSDRRGWDILFFAGHSETKHQTGKIYLNENEVLEIEEFKNTLKQAIARGLKIAIFNSCQGLGLAEEIANLNIPVVMFMHEKVTDEVATSWLEYFLTEYASGKPLHTAFRYAQMKLEKFNKELPGATLLPKLYRNLSQKSPTWKQLRYKTNFSNLLTSTTTPERPKLKEVLRTSFIVTSLVIGVRALGWLQPWELQILDGYVRLQPKVEPDPRILIVAVTQEDINLQEEKSKSSLPDEELNLLLDQLQVHEPIAIGLDIYRDFPVAPEYTELVKKFEENDRLIAICDHKSLTQEGTLPPPEVPHNRLGFVDLDDSDLTVRRSILIQNVSTSTSCPTKFSLSLQLATLYLANQGIERRFTQSQGSLQFENVVFEPMNVPWGGYQQADDKGHQILLKYRPSQPVAQTVKLSDILNNRVSPSDIQNRIVLIGVDAPSIQDNHHTPYGQLTGVALHAHMLSQILGAVLDNQPLVWVLPQWGEVFWTLSWSLGGGLIILVLGYRSPLQLRAVMGLAILGIYCTCFIMFWQRSGWIPFVPPAIALVFTTESLSLKYVKLFYK